MQASTRLMQWLTLYKDMLTCTLPPVIASKFASKWRNNKIYRQHFLYFHKYISSECCLIDSGISAVNGTFISIGSNITNIKHLQEERAQLSTLNKHVEIICEHEEKKLFIWFSGRYSLTSYLTRSGHVFEQRRKRWRFYSRSRALAELGEGVVEGVSSHGHPSNH